MADTEIPADPQATFTKTWALCLLVSLFPILGYILPWQEMSLLTILVAFFFPGLGKLLKQIARRRVHRRIRWLAWIVDPDMSVTISDRRRGYDAYEEVKAYLGESCSRKARHLIGETPGNDTAPEKRLDLSMRDGEEVADDKKMKGTSFTVWWSAFTREIRDRVEEERHRDLVLDTYLPHVRRKGRELIRRRQRMITTNTLGKGWTSRMPFYHPKTFDTLALDPKKKQEIIDDLKAFKNGSEYYAKLGRPWKRGYLLHGPPGTGKSSMVAAMANYLKYDVYDIELTSVMSNTELRELLVATKAMSVIVIEDIDCSLDLTGARKDVINGEGNDGGGASASAAAANVVPEESKVTGSRVTLSGLLNFIDGLWSACGEERILVFTTNHKDKLDPALIRSGRMDKHIEMSYCCFEAFKFLANVYLHVDSHPLFRPIEKLLREVEMTAVDVAENLTPKSQDDDANSCLHRLEEELDRRRAEGNANKARIADAARTDQGPRRSPRIKELSMPQGAPQVLD